jgi:hypothetical protein
MVASAGGLVISPPDVRRHNHGKAGVHADARRSSRASASDLNHSSTMLWRIAAQRAYTVRQHVSSGCGNDPRCFIGALVHHVSHRRLWNGHWRPLFLETRRLTDRRLEPQCGRGLARSCRRLTLPTTNSPRSPQPSGTSSRKTNFPTPHASIRCARRWQSSTRRRS